MKNIISYIRVSTKGQGKSGLGLEGQEAALELFAQQNNATIIATYREVESGKKSDRPELARAISHAKRSKAVLVVAKLDRLARNVAFLSRLMESKVDFIACDNPHANKFTIHILSAVAEFEAQQNSDRTKAALQAAKKRGVKLGSARPGHWKGREEIRITAAKKASRAAAKVHRVAADDAYGDLYPTMTTMRANGQTFRHIASELNLAGHSTRNGKNWNASQVMRVLRRVS
jgi:DNA invertase Pin-like site-specific DNA recombinase